jgi:hypothetical protein
MSDIIELSELDFDSDIKDTNTKSIKSSNFGGGLELLMNDKIKLNSSSKMSSDIDIEDLNNLENELNNLVDDSSTNNFKSKSDLFDSTFDNENKHNVRFNESTIGQNTAETSNSDSNTWDGYGKFNNVPINPDKEIPLQPQMSKEELLREKFKYLKKLEALEKKGVELSKKYTMDSPLLEMQGEYETIMEEKSKQNSVKFQGNMLMAVINGIEFLNSKFDPFDIKLDGWSEQVNENITDYDDIFSELYEKYKTKSSISPEIKLLFQLGGSAMMVHLTNTMFKSAMPGMDDILRQNPDLMRSFQSAAVNSMSQSSPGFSGFMNNIINTGSSSSSYSGPPPPLATQGPNSVPPPMHRPGNNSYANRPDLNMSRSNFTNDGINFQENLNTREKSSRQQQSKTSRPEMKGPSDINDILTGLKTKTINIQEPQSNTNDNSTISLNDLKELQGNVNLPKKSRRKQNSASNTMSLDL